MRTEHEVQKELSFIIGNIHENPELLTDELKW